MFDDYTLHSCLICYLRPVFMAFKYSIVNTGRGATVALFEHLSSCISELQSSFQNNHDLQSGDHHQVLYMNTVELLDLNPFQRTLVRNTAIIPFCAQHYSPCQLLHPEQQPPRQPLAPVPFRPSIRQGRSFLDHHHHHQTWHSGHCQRWEKSGTAFRIRRASRGPLERNQLASIHQRQI